MNSDIWTYISNFIQSDKDKYHVMLTCKELSTMNIFFNQLINIYQIIKLTWFNKFTNVLVDNDLTKLPRFITHLTIGHKEMYAPISGNIPSTVTHLKFGWDFDQPIDNLIPSSVTALGIYTKIYEMRCISYITYIFVRLPQT